MKHLFTDNLPKSQKEMLLREQLKACENLILAYRQFIQTNPHLYQPKNQYYDGLMEEYKKIQEQIIDEQIRFYVYGTEK